MSGVMNQQNCDKINRRLYNRGAPNAGRNELPVMAAWPKSLANCPEMAKLSIKPEPITDGHGGGGGGAHVMYRRGQILSIGLLLADQLADPKTENQIWPLCNEVKKRLRSVGIYKNRLVAPPSVFTTECAGDPGAIGCGNWRLNGGRFSN
ncbi:uncharacterized protein LOC111066303 [Drosophila obscura]|uniref:uncharacterized protein LOC111066303 n=1 Tax=Drosophila obscura TaxID=7282 RepID=UPI000B9F9B04|nr:uncharacterized protein LOC111066303 [Drosophila obscura]